LSANRLMLAFDCGTLSAPGKTQAGCAEMRQPKSAGPERPGYAESFPGRRARSCDSECKMTSIEVHACPQGWRHGVQPRARIGATGRLPSRERPLVESDRVTVLRGLSLRQRGSDALHGFSSRDPSSTDPDRDRNGACEFGVVAGAVVRVLLFHLRLTAGYCRRRPRSTAEEPTRRDAGQCPCEPEWRRGYGRTFCPLRLNGYSWQIMFLSNAP